MQSKGKDNTMRKLAHSMKEFFHPAQVTWPSFRDTKNKTVLVIAVTIVLAVLLLAFDAAAGLLLRITAM